MDLSFLGFRFRSNGTFNKHNDQLKFNQICHLSSKDGALKWEKHFDNSSGLTKGLTILKAKNETDKINEIIYESTRSVANRAKLAMNLNLAGLVLYPSNVDDYEGKCGIDEDTFDNFGPNVNVTLNVLNRKFPLLRTINEAILLSVNVTTAASSTIFSAYFYVIFILIGLSMISFSN